MREIDVSAGTIEYQDTDGDGHVIVLLHGVVMGRPAVAPRCKPT
jgi:hypothetical protein